MVERVDKSSENGDGDDNIGRRHRIRQGKLLKRWRDAKGMQRGRLQQKSSETSELKWNGSFLQFNRQKLNQKSTVLEWQMGRDGGWKEKRQNKEISKEYHRRGSESRKQVDWRWLEQD